MEKVNSKLFARRGVFCFFILLLLFMSCVLRVAVIATGGYGALQAEQSVKKTKVVRLRGSIYDRNMIPLTNTEAQKIAVVAPNQRCISAIKRELEGEELEKALESLNNGEAAICRVNNDISCDGISVTNIYNRYGNNLTACHLIGYTDDSGHGVSGLELAYDELLYSDEYVTANTVCDGKGRILKGIEPYFENDISKTKNGVVTTIDINIQQIVERAAQKMNSGCALVAEVGSGKIRAMASVPTFDINDIAKSLDADYSPMLNRVLYTFNVGSVFKPCVAVPIIENNMSGITYNCEGSIEIGDRKFRCHNLSGHGKMNLCDSLAQSCNCFFYNSAISLGNEEVYKTAAKLSIQSKIKLADNFFTFSGNLPSRTELLNKGTLANFSIGQGKLLASPVAVLCLYLAIAGDGSYVVPSVVEKTVTNGTEENYITAKPTKIMKSSTAKTLREYLKKVITDGTGKEAATTLTTAAGKTATAQTGRFYSDKTEMTNSWFCGFFPAEEPKYAVVVMSDSKLNVSTASVFAQIADGITEYEGINVKNTD